MTVIGGAGFLACADFRHNLERLRHQLEKLVGNDKPGGGVGDGVVRET